MTQFIIKVEVMNKADKSQKAETAFKLFDKNRDGYITREEFTKVFTFSFCNVNTNEREKSFSGFQKADPRAD